MEAGDKDGRLEINKILYFVIMRRRIMMVAISNITLVAMIVLIVVSIVLGLTGIILHVLTRRR